MLWRGVGVCPLVEIGDTVRKRVSGEVTSIEYDENTSGNCNAFKCVALVRFSGNQYANPGNLKEVDCNLCPILKEDPSYRDSTPTHEGLRAFNSDEDFVIFGDKEKVLPVLGAEEPVPEVKEIDRFDLIDISDEKG